MPFGFSSSASDSCAFFLLNLLESSAFTNVSSPSFSDFVALRITFRFPDVDAVLPKSIVLLFLLFLLLLLSCSLVDDVGWCASVRAIENILFIYYRECDVLCDAAETSDDDDDDDGDDEI